MLRGRSCVRARWRTRMRVSRSRCTNKTCAHAQSSKLYLCIRSSSEPHTRVEWDMMTRHVHTIRACVRVSVLTPDTAASVERVFDGLINSNDCVRCKWSMVDDKRAERAERSVRGPGPPVIRIQYAAELLPPVASRQSEDYYYARIC